MITLAAMGSNRGCLAARSSPAIFLEGEEFSRQWCAVTCVPDSASAQPSCYARCRRWYGMVIQDFVAPVAH
jgi:hypothetical protein